MIKVPFVGCEWEETLEGYYTLDFYLEVSDNRDSQSPTHQLLELLGSLKVIGYDRGYEGIYYTVYIKK